MEKIPENQKHKTAKTVLAIFTFTIIIILIILQCTKKTEPVTSLPFSKMNSEEKKEYLLDYMNGISDRNIKNQIALEDLIKSNFNYTEEVIFNEKPFMKRGIISNIDSGFIQINGTGIAKNSFGVKSKFIYYSKIQITDSINKVINIKIE